MMLIAIRVYVLYYSIAIRVMYLLSVKLSRAMSLYYAIKTIRYDIMSFLSSFSWPLKMLK